jgi:hypothetical protein
VLFLSCVVAPAALYAAGPIIPSPPKHGENVPTFLELLKLAIQAFLGGDDEPLP